MVRKESNLPALIDDRFGNHEINDPQTLASKMVPIPVNDNKQIGWNGHYIKTVTKPILHQFQSNFQFKKFV